MAVLQRKEPAAAAGRAPAQRHQADLQPGSRCRHECQQLVGQLTTVLLLRDRGPRTTVPPWPGGLESTPKHMARLSGARANWRSRPGPGPVLGQRKLRLAGKLWFSRSSIPREGRS